MAALTIRSTRQAISDVDHIYDFIAANNTAAAHAVVDRIDRAINGLPAHPRMGRTGRVAGARELVVPGTPYIVAYRLRARCGTARRHPCGAPLATQVLIRTPTEARAVTLRCRG
ncbi:MAG TPA: type II toxin-antitoxin system RelE/ParE family toxin [Geminicoccaceae bacterium]|nr:type II toxin-antitoxin system RelE/ParE family toxin [Geminicoccaceae bacterium]